MDVAIFPSRGPHIPEVLTILAPSYRLKVCRSVDDFGNELRASHCGVFVESGGSESRSVLHAVRPGSTPLVLVGPTRDPEKAKRGEECIVVPGGRIHQSLLPKVTEAALQHYLTNLRVRISQAPVGRERRNLADALLRILSRPPVRTVAGLAREMGCSPRVLQGEWRQTDSQSAGISLKRILSALLLLRALEARLRAPHRPWHEIAESLGITSRTLRNLCKTLVDRTPGDVAIEAFGDVIDRLDREILSFLVES